MTRQGQHDAAPTRRATTVQCATGVLTLDELLIDPIVRLLMRRDGTDAAAVRRLWEHMAAGRPARSPCSLPARGRDRHPDRAAARDLRRGRRGPGSAGHRPVGVEARRIG